MSRSPWLIVKWVAIVLTLAAIVWAAGKFAAAGSLIVTGPTRTNVNDYRAILVVWPLNRFTWLSVPASIYSGIPTPSG